jgi:hypothetical protein
MSFVEDTYQPDISRAPIPRNMNRPAPVDPVMEQIRAQLMGQATGAPTNIVPPAIIAQAARQHVMSRNANAKQAHVNQVVQQMQSDPAVMQAVLRGAQMDAPPPPQMRGTIPSNAAPPMRGTYDGTAPQSQTAQPSLRGSLESSGEEAAEGLSSSPEEEAAEAYSGGTNPRYDYTQLDMGPQDQGMDPGVAAALGLAGAGVAGAGAYAAYRAYNPRMPRQPGGMQGEFVNAPYGDFAREVNGPLPYAPEMNINEARDWLRQNSGSPQDSAVLDAIEGPRAAPQLGYSPTPQNDGSGRAAAQDFVNRQRTRQAPNVVVTPPPARQPAAPAPAAATNTNQPAAAQTPQKDLVQQINTVAETPGEPASKRPRRVAGGLSSPSPDPLGLRPPSAARAKQLAAPKQTAPDSGNTMTVKQPKNPKKPIEYDAGIGSEYAEPYDVTQAPRNNSWKNDPRWKDALDENARQRAQYKEQNPTKKRASTPASTESAPAKPRTAKAKTPKAKEPVVRTLDQSVALARSPEHAAKIRADRAANADADWKARQRAAAGDTPTGGKVLPDLTAKVNQVAAESAPAPKAEAKPKRSKTTPADVSAKMNSTGKSRLDTPSEGAAEGGMSLKEARDILAGNSTKYKGEELNAAKSRARQIVRAAEEANNPGAKPTVTTKLHASPEEEAIINAIAGGDRKAKVMQPGDASTNDLIMAIARRRGMKK